MTTEIASGWERMEIEDLSFQWFCDGYFCGLFQREIGYHCWERGGLVVKSVGVSMW